MAFSQSVIKSQAPVSCGLCETDRQIKWKCLECSLLMCNHCKEKVHSKFKTFQDHKIIDIREIGLHAEELDFKNIKCKEHAEHNCCLFCKTCDNLVCPTCVSKVHKKHDLIEIREGYDMKIDELKKGQTNIQKEKSKMVAKMDQMNKLTTAEKSKFTKVSQDILTHEKSVRAAVDNYFKGLKNELDQGHKTAMKSIESDQNAVSVSMKLVEDKDNEVQDLIQITDATKFFSNVNLIEESLTVLTPQTKSSYNSTPIFIPGKITLSNVGVIQSDHTPSAESNVVLNINKQYQTELSMILHLSTSPDNSLWISSQSDGDLQKVELEGNKLRVISNFNIVLYGMAVLPSNDVLLSTGKTKVQQLNITTGKLTDTVYNVDPLFSTDIHIVSDNKVVVGGNYDKLGRKAVFVMNDQGEHQTVYEHDQHNKPIFTYTKSITSTSNGNIHVADYNTDSDRGRVVVLGHGGGIINSYTGHTDVNKDIPFIPVKIVATPRDNVIVVDMNSNYLHILTNAGQLLTFYNIKDIGIILPFSLAFTPTGQLFIGCTKPKGATTKEAKLYEVNISGC
ncbi:E3 ubiquitin-protein ligase TRIM9-like [Mytilus californianus]|uniref:E3 ubiquitin-protein ligase TRIM9-like n=1 Tax=Mytilus californianus TaxID=6549 RepID=UPI002245B3C3|nr:E3 ubiquitin-protein ligase TRIM9-like [Mytilus californianus]